MKNILFIISSLHGGGAQRVVVNLANRLCREHHVTILIFEGDPPAYDVDSAVDIRCCPAPDSRLFYRLLRFLIPLDEVSWVRKLKRELDIDVSVSFMPVPNLTNTFSKGREKTIVSERSDPLMKGKKQYLTDLVTFRLADHIVFQSEQVRGYFGKSVLKKSSVILNPVGVPVRAAEVRRNRIVNAARLHPQKNQHLLISAFSDFVRVYPDYVLDIYGTGPLENELREQIVDLHLEEKVILHGHVRNIHEQIRDAKMFVLSSDYEGLSNALMEAMMMGLACVSTRVAGSSEIIQPEENGLLTAVGDRNGLTEAMLRLAEDDRLRERLEKNAVLTSQQFRTDTILAQWMDILEP